MHRLSNSLKILFFTSLLVSLALATSLASAEDQSLGEITVKAITPQHDSVAFTTVITGKSLEGKKSSLSEVLQEASGIQIRRYGGLDDFATVAIRGSTSEQVSVYLNGILMNQGAGRGVNIATIPTDQIEKIEIYKGAAPANFGTSSIGGVVNIITKKASKKRETKITQSYGSFKTYEGTLLHSEKHESVSAEIGYSFNHSAGDFIFVDNNGTPFNSSDDFTTRRHNNDFNRHNLLTDVLITSASHEGLSLHVNNHFFREDRGVPGLATRSSDTARFAATRNGTALEINQQNILPHLDLGFSPFFQFLQEEFSDPKGDIGLGAQDNDNHTFQYGAILKNTLLIGNHQRWGLFLQYRGEQFLPKDFSKSPPSSPKSVRNTATASLEDELFFFDEKLILNPSVRTEHVFNNFASSPASVLHPLSAKIGVKYSPVSRLSLRTNFSRSFRIPNFSELFGDRGSLVGNSSLKPEEGINWDIGGNLDVTPFHFEVSYFLNHINQLIQFLQTSQFTVRAENISRARIQGVEALASVSFFHHLNISGNYTFQWAKDTSGLPGPDGKFLPGRPMHEANLITSLYNPWAKIFSDANFMDSNFLDTQNLQRISHRLFWNAGVALKFYKKITASLEFKNILNDLTSDVVGFPLPGRSVYGKVEIEL